MDIQQIIKSNLCLGCGICLYDSSIKEMKYSPSKGMFLPLLNDNTDYEIANKICPANGYTIKSAAEKLFDKTKYNLELGIVVNSYAIRTLSSKLLENASSGGLMSQIIAFILEQKIVDKVAITKFIYTSKGPLTKTFLTDNIEEIIASQGSKYCPVDISGFIQDFKNFNGKIAYIGTPCQIAGIRKIQNIDLKFKNNIILTIASFCGGFKNYNNIMKIAKLHKIDYNKINYFRFRGGGQPGSLLMKDNKNSCMIPYPKYVGYTGYSKILRCHLCVDATGELADLACGDAWLKEYLQSEYTWSIAITRSKFASNIITEMESNNKIIANELSLKQVSYSQAANLKSKKNRTAARFKLYKILGYKLPDFNGEGYYFKQSSLITEIDVYLSHLFNLVLEKIGIFHLYRKSTFRKIILKTKNILL